MENLKLPQFRLLLVLLLVQGVFPLAADSAVAAEEFPHAEAVLLDQALGTFFQMENSVVNEMTPVERACATGTWPDCLSSKTFQNDRSRKVLEKWTPLLEIEFSAKGLELGAPVLIRTFKHAEVKSAARDPRGLTYEMHKDFKGGILEVWVQNKTGAYELFKTYPICAVPGTPGPKQRVGDKITPEGFYHVDHGQMNPNSAYHLSMNIGYPNALDTLRGSTGSAIMIHGSCKTLGCLAMTDPAIEEIYTIVDTALNRNEIVMKNGRTAPYQVPVHSFPFPLTQENLSKFSAKDLKGLSQYLNGRSHGYTDPMKFWKNIQEGYDIFESSRTPPEVSVSGTGAEASYRFSKSTQIIRKRRCP